ncbi:MAG: hypothetical protein COA36_02215 [Desulfotalea sp.]|nr:MAG: hypothetical protein COA36_02215 [Desulfotalea sp.]
MRPITVALLLVFFFSGVCLGLLIGQKTAPHYAHDINCESTSDAEMDFFYTSTLGVTDEQKDLLASIEKEYLKKKLTYTGRMAAANYRLADIIEQKGYEDPAVADVVMEIHRAMGALQHLTLRHLAQVKSVLTTKQAELLKDHVVQRLRQNL